MDSLTDDILGFYKLNPKNSWYLTKYFTDTDNLGMYGPYAKNAVLSEAGDYNFIGTVDADNTYEINSFGFRGEVYENAEVLASGCSITFGLGVPELGRWTNFLGNKMNKNIMNLGSPGASVESICLNIIKYCVNNKMPKQIFCLFPDFFRSVIVFDKDFSQMKTQRDKFGNHEGLLVTFCNPRITMHNGSIFMEMKDKRYVEDAVSPHQLIFNAVNAIYMLEAFCLTNNIELHWTTWDFSTTKIMEEFLILEKFQLKRYTSFLPKDNTKGINHFVRDTCNLDHGSKFKDALQWVMGSDYSIIDGKKTNQYAHPGIHCQYHIADFFYKLFNKDFVSA
jgi:hypothetical protein